MKIKEHLFKSPWYVGKDRSYKKKITPLMQKKKSLDKLQNADIIMQ